MSFRLHSYLISNDKPAVKIKELPDKITENDYCWFHLNADNAQTKKWLDSHLNIPDIAIDMLLSKNTRPNVTFFNDCVLLTLRAVNLTDKTTKDPFNAINIWITPSYIITVRNVKILAMDEIASKLGDGELLSTKGDFIIELINNLNKRIRFMIREIEDISDDIDEQIILDNFDDIESKLIELRKTIVRIRKFLLPQKDALRTLSSGNLSFLDGPDQQVLSSLYNKTLKDVEDLDMIKEHVVLNQEELKNHKNDLMNQSMYRISIVSALFLPLGFITGLLGVNVGGLPGLNNPSAFMILTGLSVFYIIIMFIYLYKSRQM
jgi:zinc transporter